MCRATAPHRAAILGRQLRIAGALVLGIMSDRAAAEAVEKVLFLEVLPTDASGGEISLAEGRALEVRTPKGSETYPFSAKLACVERERKEAAEATGPAGGGSPRAPRGRAGPSTSWHGSGRDARFGTPSSKSSSNGWGP